MIVPQHDPVDLLILGAGWTSTFLIPLLDKQAVKYAATTTDGRDGTIPFRYDPTSSDPAPFQRLPSATTVLITFPLKGKGPSTHLTKLYKSTHGAGDSVGVQSSGPHFIQLGATSIWKASEWQDETSPYDKTNDRAIAEDELMEVAGGAVLDLAGLYGGTRQPRNWVDRIIKSKEDLKNKGAVHLVHGIDVARAIIALHKTFTPAKRWLICDLHVYDWWDLAQDWAIQVVRMAEEGDVQVEDELLRKQQELLTWVGELMIENDVKALPRDTPLLGRVLDGRAFWNKMGLWPTQGRVR